MNIILNRTIKTPYGIEGYLSIDGQKVCDTAENTDFHLASGTYPVSIHHCRQYRRKMPVMLLNAAHLTSAPPPLEAVYPSPCESCKRKHIGSQHANLPTYCPMIKIGNGVMNRTDGSILVGKRSMPGLLIHSSSTFAKLIDRLDKAAHRGDCIDLIIKNV